MTRGMSDPKNRYPIELAGIRKGPIAQRPLLALMRTIIDAAMSKSASQSRDRARRMVRRLMTETNWNTAFIKENLNPKRCRYLSSLGYILESRYLSAPPNSFDRLKARRR